MTNEELDALWFRAMEASIRAGEEFTRYRFADLVTAAEREACAQACEEADLVEYEHCMVLHTDGPATLRNAAAAIRVRGNT